MGFAKGQSGNPNGRPKGSTYLTDLIAAVRIVEKKKAKKLLVHFVEQAYEDKAVLIALLKKFIADKKTIEGAMDLNFVSGIKIEFIEAGKPTDNPLLPTPIEDK